MSQGALPFPGGGTCAGAGLVLGEGLYIICHVLMDGGCRKDHVHASRLQNSQTSAADPFKPAAYPEDPRLAWAVLAACDLTLASRLPQNSFEDLSSQEFLVHSVFVSISWRFSRSSFHPRTDLAPLARSDRLLRGDTSSILILFSPKGWRQLQGSTGGASSPH